MLSPGCLSAAECNGGKRVAYIFALCCIIVSPESTLELITLSGPGSMNRNIFRHGKPSVQGCSNRANSVQEHRQTNTI